MDIDKICRCCMALSGPLMSIYDGGSAGSGCVADMLRDIAKLKPQQNDNMPEKVCLSCISEINRCYVFKIKCENSNRTLRQLLPDAVKETLDDSFQVIVDKAEAVTQTDEKVTRSSGVQTLKAECTHMVDKDVQTEVEIDFKELFFEEELKDDIPRPLKREHSLEKSTNKSKKRSQHVIEVCGSPIDQGLEKNVGEEKSESKTYILVESVNADSNASEEELIIQHVGQNESESCIETTLPTLKYQDAISEEFADGNSKNFINSQVSEFTCNLSDETYNIKESVEYFDEESQQQDETLAESKTNPPIIKRSHNLRREQYKCSFCIMTFVSLKVLRRHLSKRHDIVDTDLVVDEVPLAPDISDEASQSQDSTNEQMELTMDNVPNPRLLPRSRVSRKSNDQIQTQFKYFCEYCMAGFAQKKTLSYHMKQKNCIANSFKCNLCDRIFISEENLETHKETHKKQYSCLECNKECGTIEQLSEHMIEEHNRNARNQCHICKKVFTMRASLMDHLRIHSGEKPFECTVCGKRFAQNSNLRQHLMRHTNEKNFKCDICSNAYVTKAELFSHKRTHTGDHPFKCDICSSTFTSSSSLLKHKRKHTGERPYVCEYCPMRFAVLNVLKNHQRTHTGEKPYKCSYCDKCFTQKGDCLLHQRTHEMGEVVCFCGSKFAKMANLRHHLKTKHPNMTDEKRKELDDVISKQRYNQDDIEYQITLAAEDEEGEYGDNEFVAMDNADDSALISKDPTDDSSNIVMDTDIIME